MLCCHCYLYRIIYFHKDNEVIAVFWMTFCLKFCLCVNTKNDLQPNITNLWYTFVLSQNVLSRWLYVLYVTTAALKMMTNPVHERRNIMIMIYQHVIHAQVLTIIPRAGCYFNMWMEAKNSKEVTCSPLSCIKRESKKKEFQRWIQYYIWVGGYGYKDCSGGLLVGMPLWSRLTAYVASCCRDTKNKSVGKWAE